MHKRSQAAREMVLLSAGLVMAVLGGCGHRGENLAPAVTPECICVRESALQEMGLQYYWHAGQRVALSADDSVKRMLLLDEHLYLMTEKSRLLAVDASVGREKWRVSVSFKDNGVYPPTHQTLQMSPTVWRNTVMDPPEPTEFKPVDATIINDLAHMLVIDRASGEILRDTEFVQSTATTAGLCDRTHFYLPGMADMLYAIDLTIGQAVWSLAYEGLASVPIRSYGDRVYVGTIEGQMSCFVVGSAGERRWSIDYDSAILAPFTVDARGLFFATGRKIRALDRTTGLSLWEPVHVEGEIHDAMQLSDTTLYQHAQGDGLYAVNLATGDVRWKMENGKTVVAIMDGQAYVIDTANKLNVVNEITGEVTASLEMMGFDFFVPNTRTPAIYAGSTNGQIYCIRKSDAGQLTAEMLQGQ